MSYRGFERLISARNGAIERVCRYCEANCVVISLPPVGDYGARVTIRMTPAQARHHAEMILKLADIVEGKT